MLRALPIVVVAAIALVGCAEPTETVTTPPPTTASPEPTSTTTPPVDTTVVQTSSTSEGPPPCLDGDTPFSSSGIAGTFGSGTGDAAVVGGIRFAAHGGCERIVIDLQTAGGSPAAMLGASEVAVDAGLGVVTVALPPEMTTTAVADTLFEGSLVTRAFVYRTLGGALAVDLHMAEAVAARGLLVLDPARLVVDVRPVEDGAPLLGSPEVTPELVLLSPLPGPAEYPIVVHGYARTFEGNVVARLTDGTLTQEVVATAADWAETWGEFEATIGLPEDGPFGAAELTVGSDDPEDGSFVGVGVTLDVR